MTTRNPIMHATHARRALWCVPLLAACSGELAVVDDTRLGGNGAEIGAAGTGAAPSDAPCGCASSPELTPLGCDLSQGEITGVSGFPHITPDGSVVAFGVCRGDQIFDVDCDVIHWRADTGARVVLQGIVHGLTPDGATLLVTPTTLAGADESLLVEAYGTGINLPLRPFYVRSLSSDGAFVVGLELSDSGVYVARHSAGAGLERLAQLPENARAAVVAFDDDASTLTGMVQRLDAGAPRQEPFRIVAGAGLSLGLGALPSGATGVTPSDIDADGSTIVGATTGLGSVFRWTEASGIVALAPVGELYADFAGVSADGDVVASTLDPEGTVRSTAFRWTAASGVDELTPGASSRASFIDRTGSVIVGELVGDADEVSPFVWDEANGARELEPALIALGVDLTGWELGEVRALSDDGNALVGVGRCGGVPTHYRIELPN